MKFTGTGRLVCSQKVLVFFSNMLIWFVLATRKKVKLAQSSHELESQCQICHPCFYFEVGLEEKNVIKAIVAALCGGAFALAKPCNYEWYPLWPALLSVPVAKIGFVSHTPARRKIIFDPNCRHLHAQTEGNAFPTHLAHSLKSLPSHRRPCKHDDHKKWPPCLQRGWVIPSALGYLAAPLLTVPVEKDISAVVC